MWQQVCQVCQVWQQVCQVWQQVCQVWHQVCQVWQKKSKQLPDGVPGIEGVMAELQGVVPSVAWQRARPGEIDGGPVFQATSLRVMACVAAQLGHYLQMHLHMPKGAAWWGRMCSRMSDLGFRQDRQDDGMFHYRTDEQQAHILIHQEGWIYSSSSSSSSGVKEQVESFLLEHMHPGQQLGALPLMGIRVTPLACGGWGLSQEELALRLLMQPISTDEEWEAAVEQLKQLAGGTRPDMSYQAQELGAAWEGVKWKLMENQLIYLEATSSMGLDYRRDSSSLPVCWHGAGRTWFPSWVISTPGGTLSWGCRKHGARAVHDLVHCCQMGRRMGLTATLTEGLCHEVGLAAVMRSRLKQCGFGAHNLLRIRLPQGRDSVEPNRTVTSEPDPWVKYPFPRDTNRTYPATV